MTKQFNTCGYHTSGQARPSLTEECIMNYDTLPVTMQGWRRFRIEYGFECSCPEETIYLPPNVTTEELDLLESILQPK